MPLPRWQPESPIRKSNTDGAEAIFIAAPTDSNFRLVIDRIDVFNTSATNVFVDFHDVTNGSSTDGTSLQKSLTIPKDYGGSSWFGEWKLIAGNEFRYDVSAAVSTAYLSVDYHLERI